MKIKILLTIIFSLFITLFVSLSGKPDLILQVHAGQCQCCAPGSTGNNCINENWHNGNTCSWPWNMCGNKARCAAGTTVRQCTGMGGGCSPNSWSAWTVCSATRPPSGGGIGYGGMYRLNNCGSAQSAGCSTCYSKNATSSTLNSPLNGAMIDTTTPTLSWNQTNDWGFRCPNTQIRDYNIQLGPATPNGSCNITNWTYQTSITNENITSHVIPTAANLNWGTKYCWRIQTINQNTINSPIWSFTANSSDFFITYGGDVYRSSGVPNKIKIATNMTGILLGIESNETGSRIGNIRGSLNAQTPFLSSNLFISPSTISTTRASSINAVVTFKDDSSASTYSKAYTSSDSATTRSYTANYFAYYLDYFLKKRSLNPNIITKSIVNNIWASTTQYKIRDLVGITAPIAEKRIALLQNTTTIHNFILNNNPNIVAQTGFVYDQKNVFVLDQFFDWTGISTVPNKNLICEGQTIFLVPGNLTINANIINANGDSSCIFIVEGHLTIRPADKYSYTQPSNYRTIEGLFLANSVSIAGKDDQGPIVVNGAILTNNTATASLDAINYDPFRVNKFDVKTFHLDRPQVIITYDPRHIAIWAKELKGNIGTSSIRESRFIKLIKK